MTQSTHTKVSLITSLILAGCAHAALAQQTAPHAMVDPPSQDVPQPQSVPLKPAPATGLQWKALDYYDLTLPRSQAMPFAEIWADKLAANNRAYRKAGDTRFSIANAPASESDVIILSPTDEVTVTTLNTFTCKVIKSDPEGRATLKSCPMRLVEFAHGQTYTFAAPNGCYLEFTPPPPGITLDATRDATYAAFDPSDKSIRLGTLINHQPVSGCSFHLRIPQTRPDPPMMSRRIIKLDGMFPTNSGETK